jgi:tripeptide aminopeptidase
MMDMVLKEEIQAFLVEEALSRFLRYVKIWTTSDAKSNAFPSTSTQLEFGKLLSEEMCSLGFENITHDEFGYVYADLPASRGFEETQRIGLIAHLDTSSAVIGKNVIPIIHHNYDGGTIKFPKTNDIELTPQDSPLLEKYVGMDIVTSQGDTLLGADDKAGIAEILTACAAWQRHVDLKHGPVTVCFTPDEEIGRGTHKIDKSRLPAVCYTIDGSEMGELEIECFDAWLATIKFHGLNIHPGYAKNKMVNAIRIAARYFSDLPEYETPEHTEDREGFFHLYDLEGNEEEASARVIIRDYNPAITHKRMEFMKSLKQLYEQKYAGLKIELSFLHQYSNMLNFLQNNDEVINKAKKAIEKAGLDLQLHSIRGGTDGARLSEMGIPTPNIFTGGKLFHSRKEFIPTIALQKATEVILYLGDLWANT